MRKTVTVGTKEGLGAGIVGLALLLIFLPTFSQQISDLDFIQSESFAILSGSVMVLAIITMLAGLAVIFANLNDDIEEE